MLTGNSTWDVFILAVVDLTNEYRAANGVGAVTLNQDLFDAAQGHSEDMAVNDFFDHRNLEGQSPGARITEEGYRWNTYGENIAAGYRTAESVVQAWINSPGHERNLVNPNFNEIGVGYFYLTNDTGSVNYTTYWTQKFARSPDGVNPIDLSDGEEAKDSPPPPAPRDSIAPAPEPEVFTGTFDADVVSGKNLNDFLRGKGGSDYLQGNDGNDTLLGNNDNYFSDGNGPDSDTLDGGRGNDLIQGGDLGDVLRGGDGHDEIHGDLVTYFGNDRFGADTIEGGNGRDSIGGGGGDDYINGGRGADLLVGGLLPEDKRYHDNRDGNDTLIGMEGADTLLGGSGDDVMHGDFVGYFGSGFNNDLLEGGRGTDRIGGGGGDDTVDGQGGNDFLSGGLIDPSKQYHDTRNGNDSLFGRNGNDFLIGGTGDDLINGGNGTDTAGYIGNLYTPGGELNYQFSFDGTSLFIESDFFGNDRVRFVEVFAFKDEIITWDEALAFAGVDGPVNTALPNDFPFSDTVENLGDILQELDSVY